MRYWPLPYSGIPAILHVSSETLCVLIVAITWCMKRLPVSLFGALLAAMFVLSLLSCGRYVEIRQRCVELAYGFPIPVIKYVINDIVSIFDINELDRSMLLRYFKIMIFTPIIMLSFPILYLACNNWTMTMSDIPVLLVFVLLGILATLHIFFSGREYRKLTKIIFTLLGFTVFAVILVSMFIYLPYVTYQVTVLYILILCSLAIFITFIAMFYERRHVVIIKTSSGKFYAIGAATSNDAMLLIRRIVEEVIRRC